MNQLASWPSFNTEGPPAVPTIEEDAQRGFAANAESPDETKATKWRLKAEALEAEVIRLNALISGSGSAILTPSAEGGFDASRRPHTTARTEDLDTTILLDPLVATEMKTLRSRLHETEEAYRQLKEDVQVMTQFTTEGPLGRRLLEKCRRLMRENEQLGEALVAARVTNPDQASLFQAEKESFLVSQLKLLYTFNADLEAECGALIKSVNRLALANQTLKSDNEKLETQLSDLQRRLERDRSPPPSRAAGSDRRHRPSPVGRRRERSPSFEKHRDVDRRRGPRRGD